MRTLHLHVGLPKCGSSSLQSFLRKHQATLADLGFDYPALAADDIGNLTPFLMAASGSPRKTFLNRYQDFEADQASAALHAALAASTAPNMILSAEGAMMALTRQSVQPFWQGFDRVVPHLFLRPRALWIASYYAQNVRAGRFRRPLRQPPTPESKGGKANRRIWQNLAAVMNLSGHMQLLEALFGPGSVRLHFLGQGFGDPVTQFLTALDLQDRIDIGPQPGMRNTSPSAFALCALAALPDDGTDDFKCRLLVSKIAAELDPFPERGLLDAETVAQIRDFFAEDTRAFLALQGQITRDDLEPDLSARTKNAVSFAEIRRTPEWGRLCSQLAAKGIDLI